MADQDELLAFRLEANRRALLPIVEQADPATYGWAYISQQNGQLTFQPDAGNDIAQMRISKGRGVVIYGGTTAGSPTMLALTEQGAPATPNGTTHGIYAKSADSKLYSMDDSGTEYKLSLVADSDYPSYSTGTWTPVLGKFVIALYIGKQGLESTYGAAAGALNLTGLPFASNASATPGFSFTTQFQGYTKANYTQITGALGASSSTIQFTAAGSGQALATLAVGDIPTGGTVIVRLSGFYFV